MLFSDWKLPFLEKGFFAWFLLSALLLQLPEPVLDVLSFGQCAYIGGNVPSCKHAALCERCISLSNTGCFYPPKNSFFKKQKLSLVSAYKGRNKGKYIRLSGKP